ncbi:MAG: BTAD domain-containing putative transcriptional regulator [Anaerolineales bacterium]|nr:BTAD domain-containing putative transcriptional regulator [Anaerolineales bacterium]
MVSNRETLVKIRLLGSFEISRGERVLLADDWPRKKAAALLKRLAYEHRLIKDQAIDFLWPESDITSGLNNLYRALHSIRQTLDTALGTETAEAIFSFEDGILHLKDTVWVDTTEFERLCKTVPGETSEQRIARLNEALALYRGDFLPDDRYEDWTQFPKDALSRLWRETSLSLARDHLEQRDFHAVIDLLSPLLSRDPADEIVHRELMRVYALSGRRHDALRQYQACVDALASELDAPPGPETTAMYDQILRGELAPLPDMEQVNVWPLPAPVNLDSRQLRFFVGRQPEMDLLSTILRNAGQGHGRTVLIAGQSGIGKTHLAMEVLRMAVESSMTVLLGAAYEQEGRLPFQPFIEAFDNFLAEKGRSLKENPITNFQRPISSDLQQEHWALFRATARFLLEIARGASLVFLVDDLHAADETSLQLFHYLARQTRAAPVVLMATYRIDSPSGAQFNTLVNALYREGLAETIVLGALPQEAVKEIIEDILQGEASEPLYQRVNEITAGNPFFTQEVTRALHRLGKIEQRGNFWSLKTEEELSVPENLSALLRQRVSRLGHNVELALAAAAVIGREFHFEILRGMGVLLDGEILDALDSALAVRLIEETSMGYRFHHPLIRRTLYESLSRVRRANLHTRAAEAIEVIFALRPGGLSQQIEILAYHYDLSDRRDRALPYLIQAGENAANVYAFEVAVDYYERALNLMDDLGLPDPSRRWRLLESLGWWHGSILANTPKAVACFERALALEAGPDWQPAGRDVVRLHCGAAVTLITAGDLDAAEAHLQAAIMQVDEGDGAPEYADLLYNLAQLYWHQNNYQQALEAAQHSLDIANRLNQPEVIARAFEMLALACHSLGEWRAGIAYEQERARLAGAGLDVTNAFDVHL